jgi:hypothetical protein
MEDGEHIAVLQLVEERLQSKQVFHATDKAHPAIWLLAYDALAHGRPPELQLDYTAKPQSEQMREHWNKQAWQNKIGTHRPDT